MTGNPNSFAGLFNGNVAVSGTLTATVKNGMVAFPDGTQRVLHCMESPEHWFEDFGAAKLKNGRATVKLDSDFAKTIKRAATTCSSRRTGTAEVSMCGARQRRALRFANSVMGNQASCSRIALSVNGETSRDIGASRGLIHLRSCRPRPRVYRDKRSPL